jgi:hypothetical protein
LIVLSFNPLQTGSLALVRGAYFRICSDGTLRGPDNTIAARYCDGIWHLAQRRHISFECTGPVYLRVTNGNGRRECMGPYASIRAAGGAIFVHDNCLGTHAIRGQLGSETITMWNEIAFVISE